MLPDFNRLKIFYYVFKTQSSTEAARCLHITQSGVSQHLKKLEQELQTELFTRVNKRLIPTAAAQKLYKIVEGFVVGLENGVRDLNTASDIPSGELRIGAPTEFGKAYLPKIMASFHRNYPNVSFTLELGGPTSLFEKLIEAELDFAYVDILPILANTFGTRSEYDITPIIKEEFVLACSQNYYEEHVQGADYDTLSSLKYIGYRSDIALFRSWFTLHFGNAPSSLDMVFVADSSGAIISAIEEGMGIGIIVSHFISEQIANKKIVPVFPTDKKLENTIACAQLKNKTETLAESCFKDHLYNEMQAVPNIALNL